jgi:hypothetical protein
MTAALAPICCLADSQLLFWRPEGSDRPLLAQRLAGDDRSGGSLETAAYVGASNGDDPTFYALFEAAMDGFRIGGDRRRMIRSAFPDDDRRFLAEADLIVLAGGDPLRGWRIFEQSGMEEVLRRRHLEGATLLGVSAGAVQLGWMIAPPEATNGSGDTDAAGQPTFTLRLVPAIVGAHEEDQDWRDLKRAVARSGVAVRGLGIPSGGGLLYHPDQTLEPIRHPVVELAISVGDEPEGRLVQSLLMPGEISCHGDEPAHTES